MKKRRIISIILAVTMVFSCMLSVLATASADNFIRNFLNSAHKNVYAGSNFTGIDSFTLYNPYEIDVTDSNADYSFWHFIDASKKSEYAEITFENANGENITWRVEPCKDNQHFAVITPSSWKLLDGVSYSGASGNFNLSHSGRHIGQGTLNVSAIIKPYYFEITPHEYYERTVDKYFERPVDLYYERSVDKYFERPVDEYYERTVDKYYERPVDEYYERSVDEYYERSVDEYYERPVDKYYERTVTEYFERPVNEIYNRYAQKYLVPVFTRETNSKTGTLVTRLTYSDNSKKAKPINGGSFNNGHTYVEIDVKEASKDGGVWYTIADSSKNNGKKTPNQYNKPIDYKYNVQIKDGKLTVSFDDDLVSASVGAYVVTNTSKFPGNAPKHYSNSVTVDLPKNNGIVYLYTHIESLEWYAKDADNNYIYKFLEWKYDDSRTEYDTDYTLVDTNYGEYTKVNTEYGQYKLVNTKYGQYELVNTEYGQYELVNTEYGQYELVNTEYGQYELVNTEYGQYELVNTEYGQYELVNTEYGQYELVNTKYGQYELVNTEYGQYELVNTEYISVKKDTTYNGNLILTVNGEEKPLNEKITLTPGEYTFTISSDSDAFKPITKIVTVVPGDNGTIVFDEDVMLEDVTVDSVIHKADKEATIHEVDKEATVHEADKEAIAHESDKEATIHEIDKEATVHEANKEATIHEVDKEATIHEANKEATVHESDKEATIHQKDLVPEKTYSDKIEKKYNDDYIFKNDIKLGNEDDPFGEYAIRLS